MDKKELKTAKQIELVENGSNESAIEIQNKPNTISRQSFDDADGATCGDATVPITDGEYGLASETDPAQSQDDRLLGKIVGGHYEILSLIGQGGMSRVYKAKHLLLKRNVALKFLAVGRQFDAKSIARFQKEAEAASALQHINICSTREFGINEEGIPFLVMDFVEGTSLGDILSKEKTLSQNRAIEIMTGLCAGLEHAHEHGVIHRDIKPANIILTRDKAGGEVVKVVDFGIAKLIREDESGPNLTQTGEVFGTPKYMSPEQCLGIKVDQRADIYALGCILYEMLSGQPPFCDESAIKILFAHVNDQPRLLGQLCSTEIQTILYRCLEKDASKRYQSVSQLLADLQAVKDGRALLHARPTRIDKAKNNIIRVVSFTIICLCAYICVSQSQGYKSQTEFRKEWNTVHSQAIAYKQRNDLPSAEKQLEKCLEIARKSRSESIIALSLEELSEVESAQGKTVKAQEHKQALENRFATSDMSKFFITAACILIGFGFLLMVCAILVFSNKPNMTVAELFKKK